ncbi:hypothetical protein PIB30_111449, partial [Stylosanthes scabra]|nr:hypothetical protein [Stylosanthes scabra]
EVLVLHLIFGASFFARSSGLPHARGTPVPEAHLRRVGHPRRGSNTRRWAPQGLSSGGLSVRGRVLMIIACAYNGRCDHTSTNAPDPIRTPQLSLLGRE